MVGVDAFRHLLVNQVPLIDVRAEAEFARGSFPGAVNMPILKDEERHQVGLCYKQQGQHAAIELGHQLVGGDIRDRRVQAWTAFANSHANTHVFCWRGGMRSNLSHAWMAAAGVTVPVVEGGYKALRRELLRWLESPSDWPAFLIVGGKTGVAKTALVNELDTGVDLEGRARHRGSSFGRRATGPAPQAGFENALAIDMMRVADLHPGCLAVLEDEGRRIGPVSIPERAFEAMSLAPLALVEMPLAFRTEHILQEYVLDMRVEHSAAGNGDQGYASYLLDSLHRVRRRLGGELYKRLCKLMEQALAAQLERDDVELHRAWIEALLLEYYDPMYEYQIAQRQHQVVFRGDYQQVLEWSRQQSASPAF